MFDRSALYYDAIYSAAGKDYATEVETVTRLLRTRGQTTGTLLDVACGTGKHLEVWQANGWDVHGVDLNWDFVEIARKRVGATRVTNSNMTTLELRRTFDVVTCMFSSIGYLLTEAALHAAWATFARHTRIGGTVVVEPWLTPDVYHPGHVSAETADLGDGTSVRRKMVSGIRRARTGGDDFDVSVVDAYYTISSADGARRLTTERHELALVDPLDHLRAGELAGFWMEHHRDEGTGRGLLVGTRAP